jgi:hypothetical protein
MKLNRFRALPLAIVALLSFSTLPVRVKSGGLPQHHLYVSNAATNTITIYDADATGNVAPVRSIGGSNTGITSIGEAAVDQQGYVYVPVDKGVLVFAPGANGNVAPVRVIAGSATQIAHAPAVAVGADGTLYVGSNPFVSFKYQPRLLRFAPGASGNVAPTAVRSIRSGDSINAVTVDPAFGLIVSAGAACCNIYVQNVTYYSKNLVDLTPGSTLGVAIQDFNPGPVAIDAATHTFLGLLAGSNNVHVSRFANQTTGYIALPVNPSTQLTPPLVSSFNVPLCAGHYSIASDITRTIYVAGNCAQGGAIDAYSSASTGNATPLRQISGPATQLETPEFITVGP